jgi:hypothetical protein
MAKMGRARRSFLHERKHRSAANGVYYGIKGRRRKEGANMGILTGTLHGDAANELLAFYQDKALELEKAGQYFMAAIALALALETAVLTYLLVEFGEENGGELKIPDSVNMSELIEAANEIDVLSAPIDGPSHVRGDDDQTLPKHVAKEVVDRIRKFRNLIHPARALRESFDPRSFNVEQLAELKEMYESVLHSLLHYI